MTEHRIITGNSNAMVSVRDGSVNLVVTSPPYPMIEMWDAMFAGQNPEIGKALSIGNGLRAFDLMHEILNGVWCECDRALADGGFICVNIGDATRTIGDCFQLYSNHTQIINYFLRRGYSVLPDIHWRKQSNAPNKYMGSGMLPAGAYVTYEHEYILIFRKGVKRVFRGTDKERRQKSAFFWEERNTWFSDLWDIKGVSQAVATSNTSRQRNASFPLEIPYRLVNMYSVEGDAVLDPFAGFGTTSMACMLSNRNSIGFEIDPEIAQAAVDSLNGPTGRLNDYIEARIQRHEDYIASLPADKQAKCYQNEPIGCKVKTRQEVNIAIDLLAEIERQSDGCVCRYKKYHKKDRPAQLSMLDMDHCRQVV